MNDKGYQQAIENFVYEIDKITAEMDKMPGSDEAKVASFLMKGSVFEPFRERFTKLDIIALKIQETYGKTHDEFDEDVKNHMAKVITEFIEENLTK